MELKGRTNTDISELWSICSPCIWEHHSDEAASVLGRWESCVDSRLLVVAEHGRWNSVASLLGW